MTINFRLDPYDFYRFNVYHSWTRPERKIFRLRTYLTPPILGLLFILYRYFTTDLVAGDKSLINLALLTGFASFIYVLVIGGATKSSIERNTLRFFSEGKNTEYVGHKNISFNEDKIIVSATNSVSEMKWIVVEKIEEDFNYFFVYISASSALIIPKEHVDNHDEFRNLIESKIITTI